MTDFQFGDSFDRYTGLTTGALPVTTHYSLNGNSGGPGFGGSIVAGRFGGQALRVSSASVAGDSFANRPLKAATRTSSFGFAFRRNDMSLASTSAGVPIFRVRYGVSIQLMIGVDYLGRLLVGRRNFTTELIGRTPAYGLIDANSWYFLSPEIVNDPSGSVTLALDGTEVFSNLAANTDPLAVGLIDSFDLCSGTAATAFSVATDFDDFHMLNVATRWPQPSRAEVLYVNSDAGPNQWTRNTGATDFSALDDVTSDGDTTTLGDSTVGHKSRHGLTDLSTVPAAIYAGQVSVVRRKTDAGLRQIRANWISGPTTANGPTQTLGLNYDEALDPFETDPDTGSALNATGINALDVEIETLA